MMTTTSIEGRDLLWRLNYWASEGYPHGALHAEAAKEIERLREGLDRICRRAVAHPDDNDEDRKRDLRHINSIARALLTKEPTT